MSSKCKVVLLCVVYFSYEVVVTGGEVVLVNRNVTDSFRVEEDGCTSDSSVCPKSSTCQRDSGLCLCGHKPNFLNSECVDNKVIRFGVGAGLGIYCSFEPFQLIPYSANAAKTQFKQDNNMKSCSLSSKMKPQAKFPNITKSMDLQWLDDSYVKFSVSENILYFKWAKSVPGLRGTIITLHLRCVEGNTRPLYCLRAKVFGTWPSDQNPPEPTSVTNPETTSVVNTKPPSTEITKPNSPTTKSATSDVRLSSTNTTSPTRSTNTSPTSSAPSSSPGLISGESSEKECSDVLIAVLAVSLVVNVVLGIVAVFLWNKRNRMQNNQLTETEIKNIGEQEKESTENEITTYEDVETPGRIHNDGNYENPILSSPQDNNAFSPDHQYEETSNYESLRRNPLQDQSDEHHYQSLTTTQERK